MDYKYFSTGAVPKEDDGSNTNPQQAFILKNVRFSDSEVKFTEQVDVDVVSKEEERKFYRKVRATSLQ